MTRFKYRRGIRRSYVEQGRIFFACRNYGKLSRREQQQIEALIHQVGGEYANALREYLLTDAGWVEVCQKWYISDRTLQRVVKRFYEFWP